MYSDTFFHLYKKIKFLCLIPNNTTMKKFFIFCNVFQLSENNLVEIARIKEKSTRKFT
jgi:hypothetical protein